MTEKPEKSEIQYHNIITQQQKDKETLIYNELIYNEDLSSTPIKFTYNIIKKYLNESESNVIKEIKNKTRMRNIDYLKKILKNKSFKVKQKEKNNIQNEKILVRLFISFNRNIWKLLSNYKNENNEKIMKERIYLKNILKIILNVIWIAYISGNINDDSFELIMKIILDFSLEDISEKKKGKISNLKHIMFFNETIKFIKTIFNNIEEYSERKKDIIKNILIHINDNILGSLEKNNFNYINKYFLSKNAYTTSLIELAHIINRFKSNDLTNIFIDLLTNIYFFQFNYDNGMKPTLKLLEPLFFNLNNKHIDEIQNELEIIDFTLNYISALNNKEKEILLKDSCMLKQGFYLGNEKSIIYGDINNLEHDFLILFGFRLESENLYDVSLFEIYREEKKQIKIYIRKDINNRYELQIEDEKGVNSSKVNIQIKTTYIFIFQFSFKKKEIKIIYIKDIDNNYDSETKKGESNTKVSLGKEIKIKNIKQDNLKICIGCKRGKNFENNFNGFIGDFIILNAKHIKDKKDQELNELYENILKLKGNYIDLIKILSNNENSINKDTYDNIEYNSTFNESKKILEKFKNNEKFEKFKSNFFINTIIRPKYFKLVEYKDDIDYINLNNNNYDEYLEKLEKPFSVKYKYINTNSKIKQEILNKKSFDLNTSLFNRFFHIFERKFSFIEFIKYEGIHYLSLICEYYYQIICRLIKIKNNVDSNTLISISKIINEKIIKLLAFFNTNIIQTNLYQNKINETKQFFYQIVLLIFKYVEIDELNINIFKSIYDILVNFDQQLSSNKNKDKDKNVVEFLLFIRRKLFEFLINPRLFKEKNKECLDILNYIFLSLLTFLITNEIKNLDNILRKENLDLLLSYIWLLDNTEEKNFDQNGEYFEKTKNNYMAFVILFLQIYNLLRVKEEKKSQSSKNVIQESGEKKENNSKDDNKLFINQIYEKSLYNKDNPYIFYNITLLMVKSNLIHLINPSDIGKMKKYFWKENEDKESRKSEDKKIIYLSYLQVFVSFYFSKSTNKNKKESKEKKDESFLDFIQNEDKNTYKLKFDIDLFHAFISLIRQINNFAKLKDIEINNHNKEDLKKVDTYDKLEFSDAPIINEIKINNLNDLEVHIIKNIFIIILALFEEYAKKISRKRKHSNKFVINSNSSQSSDGNIEKEAYEILKKNIDIIFKYPKTKLYEKIFTCNNNILSDFFLIKWKYGEINDINYIKSALKKYYKELYKNIYCPFVFKFLLEISEQNIFINDSSSQGKKLMVLDFKADMIIFIIENLICLSKEIKSSKNKMPNFLYNILNLLIVINHELNYQINDLFDNPKLYEHLKKLINVISEGLIFSNYCIELKENFGNINLENPGKLINEIIFDLFLAIPSKYFDKNLFINTFTRGQKHRATIFFINDIHKQKKDKNENKKKKEGKNKEKNNIPELEKLKEFNNILDLDKNIREKYLVQRNKLYKIIKTNYTIYYLAKCFVYLRSDMLKEEVNKIKLLKEKEKDKESALNELINILNDDIFALYTEYRSFFELMPCGFPLYDETKKYFENNVLQNYLNITKKESQNSKSIDLYKKFFHNDLIVILKDEYKLEYCYSSRLKIKKRTKEENPMKDDENDDKDKDKKIKSSENKDKSSSDNSSLNNMSTQNTTLIFSVSPAPKEQQLNDVEIKLENIEDNNKISETNETNEEIKNIDKIKEFNHSFELIKENYTIFNPRNFFFKRIFSDIYRDFMFENKSFLDIKNIYLMKYRKREGLTIETKQMNYPIKQKNYSNFLEPRIFLRRDFNFFDEIFFPISFQYLPNSFKNHKLKDFYLYNHRFKFKKEKIDEDKILICELVTNQYIYFGKLYLFKKYIIFEKEDDPRNTNEEFNLEIFMKYSISTKSKEKKLNKKHKFIVIFFNNIQEAIKRRTLLITQSIEIFLNNGKSYYFNFFKENIAKIFYNYIKEKKKEYNFSFDINYNKNELKNILAEFREGKIKNYEYLLYLNKYSTRTYSDLSQYPVFPWLVLNRKQAKEKSEYTEESLRDMKYPVSVQSKEKREDCIKKYKIESEEGGFQSHFNNHYSNPAYIYYYLMRLNPYLQGMIRLQNYQNENPNRIFLSFESLEVILSTAQDNRELIPDFFCYFDFLLNLNCNFLGEIQDDSINDDFKINVGETDKSSAISPFVHNLFKEKKLLNSKEITLKIHDWVDIIFGKNQIPEDETDAAQSCNIFSKLSYEQKINFEKKLDKYNNMLKKGEIKEKRFYEKMRAKLDITINFGMTPKQILKETNKYEGETSITNKNELKKTFEDKLIYFEKISNDEYLFIKDIIKKDKNRIRTIGLYTLKNKNLSEIKIYNPKQINSLKKYKCITIEHKNKKKRITLYNPCYSVSYLNLKSYKKNDKIAILTCRYLGNYFNIQTKDKNINVYCEDFVTCIKGKKSLSKDIFYTGLFNGKLTEWEIDTNFEINEIKNIYSHQASITVIELYDKQNIIITASEDKYIHIRKQYDFELLTAINLSYCFANPIVSQCSNIFPSLIKISDLNLLYVLIYDLNSKYNFIRGYNLNGLFFAQNEKEFFCDYEGNNLIINNISFTKNSNLIIGFYNQNKYYSLQSWDLKPDHFLRDCYSYDKKERNGTQSFEYDYLSDMFYILYDNYFIIRARNDIDNYGQ